MVPWAVVILPALALLPLSVVISSKFTALNFSVQRSDYLAIFSFDDFILRSRIFYYFTDNKNIIFLPALCLTIWVKLPYTFSLP